MNKHILYTLPSWRHTFVPAEEGLGRDIFLSWVLTPLWEHWLSSLLPPCSSGLDGSGPPCVQNHWVFSEPHSCWMQRTALCLDQKGHSCSGGFSWGSDACWCAHVSETLGDICSSVHQLARAPWGHLFCVCGQKEESHQVSPSTLTARLCWRGLHPVLVWEFMGLNNPCHDAHTFVDMVWEELRSRFPFVLQRREAEPAHMVGNYRILNYIPQPSEILNRYIFLHSYNLRNLKDKIKKEIRKQTKMLPFQRAEPLCVTPGIFF